MTKSFAICYLCAVSFATPAVAAIVPFVESFDGDGGVFDNPGWSFSGDGFFRDGGWDVSNRGANDPEFFEDFDRLRQRDLFLGSGSFITRLEATGVDLGHIDSDSPVGAHSRISFIQRIGEGAVGSVYMSLNEGRSSNPGERIVSFNVSGELKVVTVPDGQEIALELQFDAELLQVSGTYDSDTTSDGELIRFGPFPFLGSAQATQEIIITSVASEDVETTALLDSFSILPADPRRGDFDVNNVLDVQDITLLTLQVLTSVFDPTFDLNNDLSVDAHDRVVWVHDVKQTYFGDANLDSEFASSDLVNVFATGEYEDAIALNSTWATGDWDGDQDFTSSDLVLAFQDGGYEQGPRVASSVPEPVSLLPLSLLLGWLVAANNRRGLLPSSSHHTVQATRWDHAS